MDGKTPQFTNEELAILSHRCSDPGLIMDLVTRHNTFWDDNHISSRIDSSAYNHSPDWLKLNLLAHDLAKFGTITDISVLELLEGRFEPYPYQLKVALNVLKEKSSIALLADEVGLGKTIEIGLILKEHIIRENIYSILIITPKSLMTQWQEEMREKFDEEFITCEDTGFDFDNNRIIISYGKFTRNVDKINNRQWDMVVVDEAHLLSNIRSKRRKAIATLDRRYMLLSTATPLCNRLTDIYSLVDLLYPGLFGTLKNFRETYFADKAGRVCKPGMRDELRKIISGVMVRTLRKDSGIPFTERHIYSVRVNGTKEENQLYDMVTDFMKETYFKSLSNNAESSFMAYIPSVRSNINYPMLKELISLQQSLSSSPQALCRSLLNRREKYADERDKIDKIIEIAGEIGTYSKAHKLIETLNGLPDEKAVIFTLRLETAYMLCNSFNENFMPAKVYEGRLSSYERQSLVEDFRKGITKYIIATDTAAEGLNLQDASIVVNYDLHWNPMKIEQRIGRVHRRGQEKDVNIFNLVMKDTIDDYVLKILYEKIELFKMTIGGIEAILSEMKDDDFDIEEAIIDILIRSANKRDIKKEMEKLRETLEYKKEQNRLWQEFSHSILD